MHRSQTVSLFIALGLSLPSVSFHFLAPASAQSELPDILPPFPLEEDWSPTFEPAPRLIQYDNVPEAVERLKTADAETRSQIIGDFTALGPPAIPELSSALSNTDPRVSSAVAEALGDMGAEAAPAIPQLLALVGDRSRWNDQEPSLFLPFALPPLFDGEVIPEPPVNWQDMVGVSAIAALGQIGPAAKSRTAPQLIQMLDDENPWIRLHVAWALMQMQAEVPLLPTYVNLLQRPDALVREATAVTLDDNNILSDEVLGHEATPELLSSLIQALGDVNTSIPSRLGSALQQTGTKAVPPLLEALDQPILLLRLEAIKVLGALEEEAVAALPKLTEQLNDATQYSSPSSSSASNFFDTSFLDFSPGLFGFDEPEFYRPSYSKPSNPNQSIAIQAALSIGAIGQSQPQAVDQPALQQQLQNPNPRMRLAAAWALLSSAEPEALSPSNASQYWSEQQALLNTIGDIAQTERRQPITMIGDPKAEPLQRDAYDLLESIGQPAAQFLVPRYIAQLTADYVVTPGQTANQIRDHRAGIIITLGNLGVRSLSAVPLLRDRFLDGSNDILRGYSATILGEIAMDAQQQALQGQLSAETQQQVMQEMQQVAAIMQSGRYPFNAEPMERVMTALDVLGRL